MKRWYLVSILALVIAMALSLTGCGGGGGEEANNIPTDEPTDGSPTTVYPSAFMYEVTTTKSVARYGSETELTYDEVVALLPPDDNEVVTITDLVAETILEPAAAPAPEPLVVTEPPPTEEPAPVVVTEPALKSRDGMKIYPSTVMIGGVITTLPLYVDMAGAAALGSDQVTLTSRDWIREAFVLQSNGEDCGGEPREYSDVTFYTEGGLVTKVGIDVLQTRSNDCTLNIDNNVTVGIVHLFDGAPAAPTAAELLDALARYEADRGVAVKVLYYMEIVEFTDTSIKIVYHFDPDTPYAVNYTEDTRTYIYH